MRLKYGYTLLFNYNKTLLITTQLKVPDTNVGKMILEAWKLTFNITELNMSLNRFMVTNISLQANTNKTVLVFNFKRLGSSFWLSLFIPSMCLILAAEITLFLDETHFKATITVALTANLVMYTLYKNIEEKLPEDSRLKLIDIWLLHGLLMPMIVFILLVTGELIRSEDKDSDSFRNGSKVAGSHVKIPPQNMENNKKQKNHKNLTFCACRFIIPLVSVTFIITFFVVIYLNE